MQFPNPFKKEKPAEQAAEAPRIEPQLGGEGGEPSPWDVREDPPAFNVVGEEKPLVEPERAAEPVPESVQTPFTLPRRPQHLRTLLHPLPSLRRAAPCSSSRRLRSLRPRSSRASRPARRMPRPRPVS